MLIFYNGHLGEEYSLKDMAAVDRGELRLRAKKDESGKPIPLTITGHIIKVKLSYLISVAGPYMPLGHLLSFPKCTWPFF